jgi:hypothetical protein
MFDMPIQAGMTNLACKLIKSLVTNEVGGNFNIIYAGFLKK